MAVERKILADGWMEMRVLNDTTGELEGIMELTPTYHAVYRAHLLAAQAEVAALESSAPRGGRVLRFPRVVAVALLLLVA